MSSKTYTKPTTQRPKQVIKQCKSGFAFYSARLALTTKFLENIEQSTTAPKIPTTIAETKKEADYELRRLRDGFIYILAECTDDAEVVTAKAADDGKVWYVYRYRSPDVQAKDTHLGDLPLDYHFKQYFCIDKDIHNDWELTGLSAPHINFCGSVNNIEILYSDFELPIELLDKLATDDTVRGHWMQKFNINIRKPTSMAAPIAQVNEFVMDFNDKQKTLNDERNKLRFTPIGVCETTQKLSEVIKSNYYGAVVALEDPIGTSRDLAAYHQYLEEQRQLKLKKYEYAITTAQFIDSYAKKVYAKKSKDWKEILGKVDNNLLARELTREYPLNPSSSTKRTPKERLNQLDPSLEKIYLQELKGIAPQHLDKSNEADEDIINALKKNSS